MAADIAHTAKEHVQEFGADVGEQTRHLVGEVRQRLADEAGTQSDRLSTSLRQLSDDLGGMQTQVSNDSLAAAVVQRLSEGSRELADYLQRQGPDGVAREVQEFARRKPGTFLLSAAVAGFVVGRLGKGMLAGGSNGSNGSHGSNDANGATVRMPVGQATNRPAATATAPVPASSPTTPLAPPSSTIPTTPPSPPSPPSPGRERR